MPTLSPVLGLRRLALSVIATLPLLSLTWLGPDAAGHALAQTNYKSTVVNCSPPSYADLTWSRYPRETWGNAFGYLWRIPPGGSPVLDGNPSEGHGRGGSASATAYNHPTRRMSGATWRETGWFSASFIEGWESKASPARTCP